MDQNEGFKTSTHYSDRNNTNDRDYQIVSGELRIRESGKTSWADSRYDNEFIADDDQTRRFLRNNLGALNTDGLKGPPARRPGRRRATAVGVAAAQRRRRIQGARLYDWAWLDQVTTDADPDDGGQHSVLIRKNITTGELAFYRC